jgi:hypothetical protein
MLEVERWRRERSTAGVLRCTPIDGQELGEIVVHERSRPLTRFRALVDERFTKREDTEPATRLTTLEGELATIVNFVAAGTHHTFAAVYGDDFQTIVHGWTANHEQRERIREATRELVAHFPLGLGEGRLRRFRYRPPAEWRGVMSGLVADWFPLDHPRNPSTIKVLPARPYNVATLRLDSFLHDDDFTNITIDKIDRTPIVHDALRGTFVRVLSGERVFLTAGLEDRRYIYTLRLVTNTEWLAKSEAIFKDLVSSSSPVPPKASIRSSLLPISAMAHWAT